MRSMTPDKLLAANRGEIAIRIFRAANELGLKTVSIYAEEDRFSRHRFKADEAYKLDQDKGPVGAYLDVEGIVALAKSKGVTLIHPGYGFLSENADFAERFTGTEVTEGLFTPVRRIFDDFQPTALNGVEAGAGLTLQKDNGAGRLFVPRAQARQFLQ